MFDIILEVIIKAYLAKYLKSYHLMLFLIISALVLDHVVLIDDSLAICSLG